MTAPEAVRTRDTRLVHEFLEAAAAETPDAAAVRDEAGVWTYAELADVSRRTAGWLRQRGLRAGDRLLVSLPNSRQLVGLLYAALRAGVIFVPVGVQSKSYHLAAVTRDAAPQLAIGETLSRFDGAPMAPTAAAAVITLPEAVAEIGSAEPLPDDDRPRPDDIALLIYTSGSTAGPKGVVGRHRQVSFAVAAIAERLGYRAGDTVYCRLPFAFDYALYQPFLCAMAGAELVAVEARDELSAFRAFQRSGATVLPMIPPVAQTMLRLAARGAGDVPLRLITNTGAELTRGLADQLRATFVGAAVVPMYGMTECKRITIAAPDADLDKPGTVGAALPGTQVDIVDSAGLPLAAGELGQIRVRGPHVMDGYWRDPAATAERFGTDPATGERCLFTGDYGVLDEDGDLRFVGRRDDVFKRRGVRTSVNEIEAAALDIPEVEEAAAALVGEVRECVLWVRGPVRREEVLRGISDRLESAKVPDRCLVVTELPLTASGKIDKRLLVESLREVR